MTCEKLQYAVLYLQAGARFVGTNPGLPCPSEEELVLETGAILAALESATGISPVVIGKPAWYLFDTAVAMTGSQRAGTAALSAIIHQDASVEEALAILRRASRNPVC